MQRSLTRHLLRVYDRVPVSGDPLAHQIAITMTWRTAPDVAWTPGPGFTRTGRLWARDNGDGTHTGGDRRLPAREGVNPRVGRPSGAVGR
ncbi:hypothetical protein GCM10020000_87920 [Streptomyces olivoverticillatus]